MRGNLMLWIDQYGERIYARSIKELREKAGGGPVIAPRLSPPWTAAEVDRLNRFQRVGFMHPFTCPGHDGDGDRELVATRRGWICRHCNYTQDWAHAFMLEKPAAWAEYITET